MKKTLKIVAAGMLCIMLCGCNTKTESTPSIQTTTSSIAAESEKSSENTTEQSDVAETGSDKADWQPFEPYAVNTLTKRQRSLYMELQSKITAMESFSYDVATYGDTIIEDLIAAWDALMIDAPQIKNYFWLDEQFDQNANIISLDSRYYCIWEKEENQDLKAIKKGVAKFEKECDAILADMPEDASAYEKYRYLGIAVSERLQYDYTFTEPAIMSSYGIVTGYAVCQGYAEIYQYLCMKANLFCHIVTGQSASEDVEETELHVWNLVWINDGTYHVDITWADETGKPRSKEWERYFMLSQEEILRDHIIVDGTEATGLERK